MTKEEVYADCIASQIQGISGRRMRVVLCTMYLLLISMLNVYTGMWTLLYFVFCTYSVVYSIQCIAYNAIWCVPYNKTWYSNLTVLRTLYLTVELAGTAQCKPCDSKIG